MAIKKHKKKLIIFGVLTVLIALWYCWPDLIPGPLRKLNIDIDKAIERVNKTGREERIEFKIEDTDTVLVCPPYSAPNQKERQFSEQLVKSIEKECLRGTETGHLFFIAGDEVKDHRLLSSWAEPILGWQKGGALHPRNQSVEK